MPVPCSTRSEKERCNFDRRLGRISDGGFMGHACRWTIEEVCELARQEVYRATQKHGRMQSAHEGYAVILEELDELWTEVTRQDRDQERMFKEAVQTAAMALRFIMDVCR